MIAQVIIHADGSVQASIDSDDTYADEGEAALVALTADNLLERAGNEAFRVWYMQRTCDDGDADADQ